MVHFPAYTAGSPMCSAPGASHPDRRVTPFGHLRIVGRWHLPAAFRSYPRPSSSGSSQTLFHLTILSFQLPSLTNLKKPLEAQGLEPWTLGLQSRCSSQLSHAPVSMSDRKERDPRPAYKPFTSAGPSPARGNAPSLPHGCEPMGLAFLLRKEVIQPHLPVRLPCYDFTPLTRFTLGTAPLSVRLATSGTPGSDGVTGGVYKARERIHRAMLMRDY